MWVSRNTAMAVLSKSAPNINHFVRTTVGSARSGCLVQVAELSSELIVSKLSAQCLMNR